jgi:hypothetical protein
MSANDDFANFSLTEWPLLSSSPSSSSSPLASASLPSASLPSTSLPLQSLLLEYEVLLTGSWNDPYKEAQPKADEDMDKFILEIENDMEIEDDMKIEDHVEREQPKKRKRASPRSKEQMVVAREQAATVRKQKAAAREQKATSKAARPKAHTLIVLGKEDQRKQAHADQVVAMHAAFARVPSKKTNVIVID